MRVLFREGYVEEVLTVATLYVRDKENNISALGIEFMYASSMNFDDAETTLYVYDNSISIDDAERRANQLIRELLLNGFADFSQEPMDIA